MREYKESAEEEGWEFPSFEEECAICLRSNCAKGNGFYSRNGFDKDNSYIEGIPIKRYICTTNIKSGKDPKSFSLLLSCLNPYRKYSLSIMSYCAGVWKKCRGKMAEVISSLWAEENIDEELLKIEASQVMQFIQAIKSGLRKYILWTNDYNCGMDEFIDYIADDCYRGAEILHKEYYEENGGYASNSHFLFGKASQFRSKRRPQCRDR